MSAETEITELISDRKTLLDGMNEITRIAQDDYGITRTTMIRIQEILRETMKNLKYDQLPQHANGIDG